MLDRIVVGCVLFSSGLAHARQLPGQAPEHSDRSTERGATAERCGKVPVGMSCIPGGPFLRGSTRGPVNSRPQASVWLQTFYMDRYEVTVKAYRECVLRKQCARARTRYRDYGRDKQPKVGVSWYDAVQYCQAVGKHLPTEAEWEKAARGTDGRLYPWGDERATCARAVIKDRRGRSCGVQKKKGRHPKKGRTLEVGSRPPALFGLYDMAGNSWEWVADWYASSYAKCGDACRGRNPRGPCDGKAPCPGYRYRIVRGGSWYWPANYATAIYRRPHVPSNRPYHHFGFRCAATIAEATRLLRPPRKTALPITIHMH